MGIPTQLLTDTARNDAMAFRWYGKGTALFSAYAKETQTKPMQHYPEFGQAIQTPNGWNGSSGRQRQPTERQSQRRRTGRMERAEQRTKTSRGESRKKEAKEKKGAPHVLERANQRSKRQNETKTLTTRRWMVWPYLLRWPWPRMARMATVESRQQRRGGSRWPRNAITVV